MSGGVAGEAGRPVPLCRLLENWKLYDHLINLRRRTGAKPQRLKPAFLSLFVARLEAVPFPNTITKRLPVLLTIFPS